jgi:site-specific recombinase XerD
MTLHDAITQYVAFNQALGMRFQVDAGHLAMLHRQVGAIDLAALAPEHIAAFLRPRREITATYLMKQRALRRFYHYAMTRGWVTASPVPTIVPRVVQTFVPHIYTQAELQRLLDGIAPHQADPRCTIPAPTLRAVLLLLYGTGLRLGEVLALQRGDLDVRAALILIRETKFYKSRQLPIGPALTEVLATLLRTTGPAPNHPPACFVNRVGVPLPEQTLRGTFVSLCAHVGISGRLHDFRHTFAVHRLLAWYREGADVQRLLPHLATYLGHARISSTQRYLTMIPELLAEASQRFERYAQPEVAHA